MAKKKEAPVDIAPEEKQNFYEKYENIINPLLGIGAIILAAIFCVIVIKASVANHDRNYDTFQEIYQETGVFNTHNLQPLGPTEIVGSSFYGNYFSVFIVSAAEVSGQSEEVLSLRFAWTAPNGDRKVKTYPYEKINFKEPSEQYTTPQMEIVFTKATLNQEYVLFGSDFTVYDFNMFFEYAEALNIYMNEADFNYEMNRIKVP